MTPDTDCSRCRLANVTEQVCQLGRGPRKASIMVVQDTPELSHDAASTFKELLRKADIEDVYLASAVSCQPGIERAPTKGEIKACRYWLMGQIEERKPSVVLLMGSAALMAVTGKAGIRQLRGRPFTQDGVVYLPTFSPGYLLHDPRVRPLMERDFAFLKQIDEYGGIPKEEGLDYIIVGDQNTFQEMLEDFAGAVSFDIETTGLDPFVEGAKVISIGFGTRSHQWCLPLNHPESPWPQEELQGLMDRVSEHLKDCELSAHNGKFDSLWLRVHFGIRLDVDFDTQLAHYLIDENQRHGLKYLAQLYYGAPNYDASLDTKTGHSSLEEHCLYLAHDVYYTRRLRFTLGKELIEDEGSLNVFEFILMPCARAFVDIEFHGVYIDTSRMDLVEADLRKRREEALEELSKYGDINWRSSPQLSTLLFKDLKIPIVEKTPKGKPSTSESVLKRIDHPVAKALIEYRSLDKMLSTFIEGWKPFLHNSRLHPRFKLSGAVTGRPSCEHPNLQQVTRDPLIRSLITAPPGWVLVEVDLSQAEMRVAAELSRDPELISAFLEGRDVHWLTALREIHRARAMKEEVLKTARILLKKEVTYDRAIDELIRIGPDDCIEVMPSWKDARKKAKAVNFGYLFGMWWKKFQQYARDNYGVTVTEKQAQDSRVAYFELYKGLVSWHRRQKMFARRNGYVRALSGRKRHLPDAQLPHDCRERGEAERQSINAPVQCFANELNLMTAVQLHREFTRDEVNLVGTVHDAILMEVREDLVQRVVERALKIMTRPATLDELQINLSVPILGDASIGPWGTGVSLEKWRDSRSANRRFRRLKRAGGNTTTATSKKLPRKK